jgi:hypothetical protein
MTKKLLPANALAALFSLAVQKDQIRTNKWPFPVQLYALLVLLIDVI